MTHCLGSQLLWDQAITAFVLLDADCTAAAQLSCYIHAQVLGTPSKEDIRAMNPNYTDFKFPQIKAHPWGKVFSKRMPADAVDLVCISLCASQSCCKVL